MKDEFEKEPRAIARRAFDAVTALNNALADCAALGVEVRIDQHENRRVGDFAKQVILVSSFYLKLRVHPTTSKEPT